MSSGKIIVGILAGLAVGATLGILFAPDKGSETRKKISQKSGELTGNVKEKIVNLFHSSHKKTDNVPQEA